MAHPRKSDASATFFDHRGAKKGHMKVLITGVTSFTGMWFVRELATRGHHVVAFVRGQAGSYSGLRAARLEQLAGKCDLVYGLEFGDDGFISALDQGFDLFCHHGAETNNYRSADFDAYGAAGKNTRNIVAVLRALKAGGCRRLLLTGSVFEAHEGAGSAPLRSFSPYGLSKTLTSEIVSYYADREGFGFGKFVIPNPFGAFEEPRFCDYLLSCWSKGQTASVNTPAYVRDNVPISLLAPGYARFAEALPESGAYKLNPGYYVESQGAFAQRYAREMSMRLEIECPLAFAPQTEFPEPRIRINFDLLPADEFGWDEAAAWQELAEYYAKRFGLKMR